MTALCLCLHSVNNYLHMANCFNNQPWFALVLCWWSLCNSRGFQMKTCHVWRRFSTNPSGIIPDLSIVWELLSTKFSAGSSTMFRVHSSSPTAGQAGQIVQSGVWFWNIQMRWNLNEGRLSSMRRCTAMTRSLLSFARVFFLSWIEYQLISWVICCSHNWVKGWEQTAHIQASHQGTVDNKRVLFYSWFSLFR